MPDAAGLAQRGLAVAGYSEDEVRAIAREAIEGIIDLARNATETRRLVVSGGRGEPSRVEEYEDIDNGLRLSARVELAKMAGTYVSRSDPRNAGPAVVINLPPAPDWAAPRVVEGEVVRSEPAEPAS